MSGDMFTDFGSDKPPERAANSAPVQQAAPVQQVVPVLAPKLVLAGKGESGSLSGLTGTEKVGAQLAWTSKVDLDLWAFITLKEDPARTIAGPRVPVARSGADGLFKKLKHFLTEGEPETVAGKPIEVRQQHNVGYSSPGSVGPKGNTKWNGRKPYAWLDGDEGIGGNKREEDENITFERPEKIQYALIAANIFSRIEAFSKYDGVVRVKAGSSEIEVPLNSDVKGNWCVVAGIDFTGNTPRIVNINETLELRGGKPKLVDYMHFFE